MANNKPIGAPHISDQPVPDSRVYRHTTCGAETTIGGQSFEVASNPMSDMTQSYCSQCGGMVPITKLQWADSGELISDYYAPHTQNATDTQRKLCSKKSMMTVIAIFALGGAIVLNVTLAKESVGSQVIMAVVGFLVGAFIGAALFDNLISEPIKKKVTGVKDTRTLN